VGTQATVKSLTPEDLSTLGVQLYFVNTYHMYLRPGIDIVKKSGGLHTFMNWDRPLMTDSGGFQVYSLGRDRSAEVVDSGSLVKITDEGVRFRSHWDGSPHVFTPETSMRWQWELGADIHIAFDDCTSYPVTREKARRSMERTHRWALRSLTAHEECRKKHKSGYQALYGSIQGSVFKELRQESANYISSLDFDGLAIGGVAVGESKKQMADVLRWVTPFLPDRKPRHLLGVGEIDDIFTLVEYGMDTFDCVQPTRLARMGHLYSKSAKKTEYQIDIQKRQFEADMRPVDDACACYTCANFSRAYIHHLFHVRELLAYRLATIHNIYFIEQLIDSIRKSIADNTFLELKKQWLYNR
jgi:tRNA-guanine transglycosylase